MIVLTKENASKVSTVRNIANPEWGIKRFQYHNYSLFGGKYQSSVGSGCNSSALSDCEFHLWEVMSWKEGVAV